MQDIEKLYYLKNKLGHPTVEDIAIQHNELLNDILSFPTKHSLDNKDRSISPLRTPNDIYKDKLLQKLHTTKTKSKEKEWFF